MVTAKLVFLLCTRALQEAFTLHLDRRNAVRALTAIQILASMLNLVLLEQQCPTQLYHQVLEHREMTKVP